jgi:hypothetical protein
MGNHAAIMRTTAVARRPAVRPRRERRISHRVRPDDMDVVAWQRALRIQAGEEAHFRLRNLGEHAIFSEFAVGNPAKGSTYRVAIRGERLGVNYCSCADFATNRLGVCKHIAFVLQRLRRRASAARQLQAGHTPPFSEIAVAYEGRPRLRLLVGGECPPAVRKLAAQAVSAAGEVDMAAIPRLLRTAERLGHEVRVYDDARDLMAADADDLRRRRLLAAAYPKGAKDTKLPRLLRGLTLHPYQCEGAYFLAERGRALLADDMGLGKTAQAIAAALMLERETGLKHILFVVPASLTGQWAEEIERFTGQAATVIRGLREVRHAAWTAERGGWTVATYDCLHRDLAPIQEWGVDLLILDEAQRIKNWPTRAAQAVRRIDCPACFVLTGTPMENKIDELHALIEVVDRHLLGPLFAFKERHTEYEAESGKVIGYHGLDRVAAAVAPVLLRRTRAQVMDQLPNRSVVVLREPLTVAQRGFHEEDKVALAFIVKRWHRLGYLTEVDQKKLMKHLQRMRMVCDDAYLIDQDLRAGPKLDQITTLLEQELGEPSTKVVIFSTWMAMHELIRGRLDEHGWGYAFLHGGVPSGRASGADPPLPRGRLLPGLPQHRLRRDRAEPPVRDCPGECRPALESGRARAAHQPHPPPGAAPCGAHLRPHCRGRHRSGHRPASRLQVGARGRRPRWWGQRRAHARIDPCSASCERSRSWTRRCRSRLGRPPRPALMPLQPLRPPVPIGIAAVGQWGSGQCGNGRPGDGRSDCVRPERGRAPESRWAVR